MSAFTATTKPTNTTPNVQTSDDWLRLSPAERREYEDRRNEEITALAESLCMRDRLVEAKRREDEANEAEYAQQMQQVEEDAIKEELRRGSSYISIAMDEERLLRDSTQLSEAELTPVATWARISARITALEESDLERKREFYADLHRRTIVSQLEREAAKRKADLVANAEAAKREAVATATAVELAKRKADVANAAVKLAEREAAVAEATALLAANDVKSCDFSNDARYIGIAYLEEEERLAAQGLDWSQLSITQRFAISKRMTLRTLELEAEEGRAMAVF
jgi:hypothetical protein